MSIMYLVCKLLVIPAFLGVLACAAYTASADRPKGRPIPEAIDWERDYPPVAPPASTAGWGEHIQRSMSLLADSTPEKRNTVRILFYGQSIVGQKKWPDAIAHDLARRFPHAEIVYDNRAIGGFASQYLVNTAEGDLYPFYPDLVVFHVYGAHDDYQRIIHNIRSRTTAEIAIVTDHPKRGDYQDGRWKDRGWWGEFMMGTMVPKVAQKYGCQLIDIHPPWKKYLETHSLNSAAMLNDGVHPNDYGKWLMSELVGRQLVHTPGVKAEADRWVKTYRLGADVHFKDGKLTLPFAGNRVVALAGKGDDAATLDVRIDGRKPSTFPTCYAHTRTSGCPNVAWPAILRIDWKTDERTVEDWTLTVDEVHKPNTDFTFHVVGSKTGRDGSGRSTERFVSDSGRVIIEPEMWHVERDFRFKKGRGKAVTPGWQVRWSTVPLFVDRYEPPAKVEASREYPVTLAQDLPNGKHTLTLTVVGDGEPTIEAIRVYCPPVTGKMDLVANPPPRR